MSNSETSAVWRQYGATLPLPEGADLALDPLGALLPIAQTMVQQAMERMLLDVITRGEAVSSGVTVAALR